MPEVVISFTDGEVLHVLTPDVTFELALLEAEFPSIEPNSERAIFPVSAIRQLLIGEPHPAPPADELNRWDRAAFHFTDGEVLRASISPQAVLGRFGGVWDIVEPGDDELRTIGIPYTSLKGVYRIKHWDSRPINERSDDGRLDQLARILAEREAGSSVAADDAKGALLSRVRKPREG
ncbi:MAG: hypothetical protein ABR498_02055 [Candidatus Dormibacteria bacterium]